MAEGRGFAGCLRLFWGLAESVGSDLRLAVAGMGLEVAEAFLGGMTTARRRWR